jgi:hypothetical protein
VTTATPTRRYLNRKQRELNTHRGIPNRVDAREARAHLAGLRRTMGWVDVATATGCSAAHLREVASGRTVTINRVTHDKIMSTQVAAPSPGLYLDATGTRRRIQVMQVEGYSQQAIADAADTTQYRVYLIAAGAARVRQTIACRIADAYEQLAHHEAPDDRFTRRTRAHAARQGWRDRAYWDDVDRIDNPDFDPDAKLLRIEEVAEDARWLIAGGLDRDQAADRLGVSRFYVDKALREVPEQVAA